MILIPITLFILFGNLGSSLGSCPISISKYGNHQLTLHSIDRLNLSVWISLEYNLYLTQKDFQVNITGTFYDKNQSIVFEKTGSNITINDLDLDTYCWNNSSSIISNNGSNSDTCEYTKNSTYSDNHNFCRFVIYTQYPFGENTFDNDSDNRIEIIFDQNEYNRTGVDLRFEIEQTGILFNHPISESGIKNILEFIESMVRNKQLSFIIFTIFIMIMNLTIVIIFLYTVVSDYFWNRKNKKDDLIPLI